MKIRRCNPQRRFQLRRALPRRRRRGRQSWRNPWRKEARNVENVSEERKRGRNEEIGDYMEMEINYNKVVRAKRQNLIPFNTVSTATAKQAFMDYDYLLHHTILIRG